MTKYAFKMKLRPGCRAEYIRRHDAIWPELKNLLSQSGIKDYTIYFDEETLSLFAVQYLEGATSQDLGQNPIVQKWWKYMAELMETNPDSSPITIPLEKVFHMD
jgi:L-rhamnose mutarotase